MLGDDVGIYRQAYLFLLIISVLIADGSSEEYLLLEIIAIFADNTSNSNL